MRSCVAIWIMLALCGVASSQSYRLDSLRSAGTRGGDGLASLNLAEGYRFGRWGLTHSPDSERVWIARAAAQGQPEALYLQGCAYLRGQGVKRDLTKALTLLDRAATAGYTRAARTLVDLYSDTTHRVFDADTRVPINWPKAHAAARLGAQQGDASLAYYLGWSYRYGRGVRASDSLAIAWLDTAARRGEVRAQLLLGDIYLQGTTTVVPDLERAAFYYRQAATHPYAQIEETTAGRVGLHHVEQLPRAAFNHSLRLNPFWPWGALELRYRK